MSLVKKLENIFGSERVSRRKNILSSFNGANTLSYSYSPECVVKPVNSEEIKILVDYANQTSAMLVPVSSGKPHFRGGSFPATGGAIIVDLSDMKRIIRIDRKNRVAMVEPGVTFHDLIPELTKHGLRLNLPLMPRKTKSVVGSMLDREAVIMPKYQWDIADPLSCVEVVFGTGDLFRTGAAAGPGTLEEQWAAGGAQKEAAGPLQASWYRVIQGSQGTMGIVTWGSMRCEILPRLEEPFFVGSPDLDRLLELVHWLVRLRIANECFLLNKVNLAAIFAEKKSAFKRIKCALPPWILFFNIAGYDYFPEERVRSHIEDMMEICQRIGLTPVKAMGDLSATKLLDSVQYSCDDPYWKIRNRGACHDIFALAPYECIQGLIDTMHKKADDFSINESDMGVYIQPLVQGSNYHCEFNIFFDPKNEIETEHLRVMKGYAVEALINKGAFFSRPHGDESQMILNRDAATVSALKKIKKMVDPNNVMSPGKLCF